MLSSSEAESRFHVHPGASFHNTAIQLTADNEIVMQVTVNGKGPFPQSSIPGVDSSLVLPLRASSY